jgi:hypothetical protein
MPFDLASLIHLDVNLDFLVESFIKEEIDRIIKIIPPDKSPSLDDFNGMLQKKCLL